MSNVGTGERETAVWLFGASWMMPPRHATTAVAVIEERDRYKREVERGGGDLWSPDDRPRDVADIMIKKLGIAKFEKVMLDGSKIIAKLKKDGTNK